MSGASLLVVGDARDLELGKTDAHGVFAWDLRGFLAASETNPHPAPVVVRAWHEDWAPVEREIALDPLPDRIDLTFSGPSGTVSGRVVVASSRPLTGPMDAFLWDADAQFTSARLAGASPTSTHLRRVRTDGSGNFVFRGLAPDRKYALAARAPGMTVSAPTVVACDAPPVELTILPVFVAYVEVQGMDGPLIVDPQLGGIGLTVDFEGELLGRSDYRLWLAAGDALPILERDPGPFEDMAAVLVDAPGDRIGPFELGGQFAGYETFETHLWARELSQGLHKEIVRLRETSPARGEVQFVVVGLPAELTAALPEDVTLASAFITLRDGQRFTAGAGIRRGADYGWKHVPTGRHSLSLQSLRSQFRLPADAPEMLLEVGEGPPTIVELDFSSTGAARVEVVDGAGQPFDGEGLIQTFQLKPDGRRVWAGNAFVVVNGEAFTWGLPPGQFELELKTRRGVVKAWSSSPLVRRLEVRAGSYETVRFVVE